MSEELVVDHEYIRENVHKANKEEVRAMLFALDLEQAVKDGEIIVRYDDNGEARLYPAGYFDNE